MIKYNVDFFYNTTIIQRYLHTTHIFTLYYKLENSKKIILFIQLKCRGQF